MAIRLYDSAWVILQENSGPIRVRKDRSNPAVFHVGDHRYDIDGRAFLSGATAPDIVKVLSLQAAHERGLSTQYDAPKQLLV